MNILGYNIVVSRSPVVAGHEVDSNDPFSKKSLLSDRAFRAMAASTVVLSIAASAVIYINGSHGFCPTYDCFNRALEYHQFPLLIIKAGVVALTLYGLVFRSGQTQRQIALTIEQNTFKNYIDHRDGFFSLMEKFRDEHKGLASVWESDIRLYKNIFYYNSFRRVDLDIQGRSTRFLESMLDDHVECMEKIGNYFSETRWRGEQLIDEDETILCIFRLMYMLGTFIRKYESAKAVWPLPQSDDADATYVFIPDDIVHAIESLGDLLELLHGFALPSYNFTRRKLRHRAKLADAWPQYLKYKEEERKKMRRSPFDDEG